jgi:hypothetical protein
LRHTVLAEYSHPFALQAITQAAAAAFGLALHDHFLIRFQFYDNDPIPSDGYVIDNVQVRATVSGWSLPSLSTKASSPARYGALDPVWQPVTTVEGRIQVSAAYRYRGTSSMLLDDDSDNWQYPLPGGVRFPFRIPERAVH